jgi:hypothetical protein
MHSSGAAHRENAKPYPAVTLVMTMWCCIRGCLKFESERMIPPLEHLAACLSVRFFVRIAERGTVRIDPSVSELRVTDVLICPSVCCLPVSTKGITDD